MSAPTILNEQLLKQCQHRYRSLEVELLDAAQLGHIGESTFKDGMKKLSQLQKNIENLLEKKDLAAEVSPLERSIVELPILSNASRLEQKIILATLSENTRMLTQISTDQKRIFQNLRMVNEGKLNWFKVMMQLSWARTRISWATKQLDLVRGMRQALERFIAKLSPHKAPQELQDGDDRGDLVNAFRDFEASTHRISGLRTKLQQEIAINQQQDRWLQNYEENRRRNTEFNAPPVPAELIQARQEVEEKIGLSTSKVGERIKIATKLATSLTTGPRPTPKKVEANAKTLDLSSLTKQPTQPGGAKKRPTHHRGGRT